MKTFISLAAVLLSMSAFACPNLKGTYDCHGKELRVSQFETDGVATYRINDIDSEFFGVNLVADGEKRSLVEFQVQANCIEDTLRVRRILVGPVNTVHYYSLTKEGSLKHSIGKIFPKTEVCQKIK